MTTDKNPPYLRVFRVLLRLILLTWTVLIVLYLADFSEKFTIFSRDFIVFFGGKEERSGCAYESCNEFHEGSVCLADPDDSNHAVGRQMSRITLRNGLPSSTGACTVRCQLSNSTGLYRMRPKILQEGQAMTLGISMMEEDVPDMLHCLFLRQHRELGLEFNVFSQSHMYATYMSRFNPGHIQPVTTSLRITEMGLAEELPDEESFRTVAYWSRWDHHSFLADTDSGPVLQDASTNLTEPESKRPHCSRCRLFSTEEVTNDV
ncbi:hypothetical protein R1flu_012067 [Riccia fluitans]|uniref:Uncharacterized protein n=1 Tax=Riccia fluitans TaxID=41844 RepID=A0ABD1ZAH7_9MARC